MITANLVVKNEEEYLEQVLTQVFKLADEVLIADNGSTDNTIEIIKKFSVNYFIEDNRNVCDVRNLLLEKSKGDWIWIVDGDEFWPDEVLPKLKELLKNTPEEITAYAFTYHQIMPFGEANHKSRPIRFFRNKNGVKWVYPFPREILSDNDGIMITQYGANIPRQNKDLKFVEDIKYIHYSGVKISQWRDKQPKKYYR